MTRDFTSSTLKTKPSQNDGYQEVEVVQSERKQISNKGDPLRLGVLKAFCSSPFCMAKECVMGMF